MLPSKERRHFSLISMIYSPTFILIVHFQTRDPISIESRQVFSHNSVLSKQGCLSSFSKASKSWELNGKVFKMVTMAVFKCDELASCTSKDLNSYPSFLLLLWDKIWTKSKSWQTNQFLPYSNKLLLSADFQNVKNQLTLTM